MYLKVGLAYATTKANSYNGRERKVNLHVKAEDAAPVETKKENKEDKHVEEEPNPNHYFNRYNLFVSRLSNDVE